MNLKCTLFAIGVLDLLCVTLKNALLMTQNLGYSVDCSTKFSNYVIEKNSCTKYCSGTLKMFWMCFWHSLHWEKLTNLVTLFLLEIPTTVGRLSRSFFLLQNFIHCIRFQFICILDKFMQRERHKTEKLAAVSCVADV